MEDGVFRVLTGLLLSTGIGISVYHRRKADRQSQETIPRQADGAVTMALIRVLGLLLWLVPVAYLVSPRLVAWAKMGLPDWARWTGVAASVLCVCGIYWLFSSIGTGITATSATRTRHVLSTRGPYRWIRHPLYTFGAAWFVTLGVIADVWAIGLLGIVAFIGMAIRTPREEANLLAEFGDEYRDYMARTGRFLPRLTRAAR